MRFASPDFKNKIQQGDVMLALTHEESETVRWLASGKCKDQPLKDHIDRHWADFLEKLADATEIRKEKG